MQTSVPESSPGQRPALPGPTLNTRTPGKEHACMRSIIFPIAKSASANSHFTEKLWRCGNSAKLASYRIQLCSAFIIKVAGII